MQVSSDIPEGEQEKNGLFGGGLSAYKSISTEEYRVVLKRGLIVLDTNSLLDLYRYHERTRKDFLRLYESLGDQLWVPHHVIVEFHGRRMDVLSERVDYPESIIAELQSLVTKYNERLATWTNRISLAAADRSRIAEIIGNASREIEAEIRKLSRDDSLRDAEDTSKDPVLAALEPILRGHVGSPLTADELRDAKAEARRRIEYGRPPGFMDAGKKGENSEGDYLIWYQTLLEAARRRVDVLFITRDQKKDWWRIEKGQARGPRWELAAELESLIGTRLYMLRPPSLAEHAPQPLPEESVQDARRVSSKARVGWRPRPGWGTVRDYVEVARDEGGIDISCKFIFDDGSGSQPIILHNASSLPELGEYARGILSGENLTIRVGAADGMSGAEGLFERINGLEPGERAHMFMEGSDLAEDCGWSWTTEYKLVKAAPGLVYER
jgi:hypothetical protein